MLLIFKLYELTANESQTGLSLPAAKYWQMCVFQLFFNTWLAFFSSSVSNGSFGSSVSSRSLTSCKNCKVLAFGQKTGWASSSFVSGRFWGLIDIILSITAFCMCSSEKMVELNFSSLYWLLIMFICLWIGSPNLKTSNRNN